MVKDFINNDHTKTPLSDVELKSIHRELVHRHVAWLTALRYQLRKDKPWEQHLKATKSNREFRESNYLICEDTIPIEEAIKPYLNQAEYDEIFAKGNQASQLIGISIEAFKRINATRRY